MKTTALPVPHQQFLSWSALITRIPDFIALTKPRVMALAVFTAEAMRASPEMMNIPARH